MKVKKEELKEEENIEMIARRCKREEKREGENVKRRKDRDD